MKQSSHFVRESFILFFLNSAHFFFYCFHELVKHCLHKSPSSLFLKDAYKPESVVWIKMICVFVVAVESNLILDLTSLQNSHKQTNNILYLTYILWIWSGTDLATDQKDEKGDGSP